MTRGALPHGGGGRRFFAAGGQRFERPCVAAFAPAAAWVRVCPGPAARKRFERPSGARNAACGTQRRIPPGHAPAAHSKGLVAFARRVRRVAAPAAVGASPRPPLAPWVRVCPGPPRASVSSALLAQETRLVAPPRSPSRSLPPAPPVRGLENSHSRWSLNCRGRRVPAPTARAISADLPRFRYAQAFRVPKGHKKRGSSHAAAHTAGPRSPHQPSGGSEGSRALRAVFRIRRHARRIRQPCASKATLRRPPPGEAGGKAAGVVGGRRNPVGKDRQRRAFPTHAPRV